MVVAEAFEGALGDAQVELDDAAAVVGLLADYLGQGWVFLLCCYAHKFYHITLVKGVIHRRGHPSASSGQAPGTEEGRGYGGKEGVSGSGFSGFGGVGGRNCAARDCHG